MSWLLNTIPLGGKGSTSAYDGAYSSYLLVIVDLNLCTRPMNERKTHREWAQPGFVAPIVVFYFPIAGEFTTPWSSQ